MLTQTVLTASTKGNKRKSDASDTQISNKKARTVHSSAEVLVKSILASPDAFPLPSSEGETRDAFVSLAQYVKALQADVKAAAKGSAANQTPEELEAMAEKLRNAARSGIKKQMTWKPSCKTRTAKWSYDGVCANPDVFAILMGLDSPPSWKMKKIAKDDFEELMGDAIHAPVRYGTLEITSKDVNVKWSPSTGEFKFSGSYGK